VVDPVDRLVSYLAIGGTALTVVLMTRLIASGLWRRYPWFVGYLFALSIESGALAAIHERDAKLEPVVWVCTRLVTVFLELHVVLEIFGRWTFSFPGIGAFGRKMLVFVLLIATVVAILTFPVSWPQGAWDQVLKGAVVVNRGAVIGFAIFLTLTLGFFWKFGGPVAPNLRRHTWAMTAYVTATAVSYFAISSFERDQAAKWGNTLLPGVTLAALVFWIFAMNPTGEEQPDVRVDDAEWEEAEEMNRHMQKLADAITLSPRGGKKG